MKVSSLLFHRSERALDRPKEYQLGYFITLISSPVISPPPREGGEEGNTEGEQSLRSKR